MKKVRRLGTNGISAGAADFIGTIVALIFVLVAINIIVSQAFGKKTSFLQERINMVIAVNR